MGSTGGPREARYEKTRLPTRPDSPCCIWAGTSARSASPDPTWLTGLTRLGTAISPRPTSRWGGPRHVNGLVKAPAMLDTGAAPQL
jgi:hypothetical protein